MPPTRISVIIPCLNEALTVGGCIDRAKIGIAATGYEGEILVLDNGSTDDTRAIAEHNGARVISVAQKGYGNAVRAGLAHARGMYVVIADGDGSYDFAVLDTFIDAIEKHDFDLVVGNRFTGEIKKGAMPFINRYFGNPFLSGVGRLLFGNPCGDFHCGLRAGKKDALLSLNLQTGKMESATEMIIKAAVRKLKIGELPITLYPDGRNRPPHLRRWRDGFANLVMMLRFRFFGRV